MHPHAEPLSTDSAALGPEKDNGPDTQHTSQAESSARMVYQTDTVFVHQVLARHKFHGIRQHYICETAIIMLTQRVCYTS